LIGIINKYLYRGVYWLTALTSFLFFIMVCLNVFTRYVLKTPILSSIELSRIFFVWACFLAAGITFYKNGHIVISFVTDPIPTGLRKLINVIIQILIMLFLTGISYWSIEVVLKIWNTEFPILGVSQSWLYIPLTLISMIMLLFNIEMILQTLKPSNPEP